jgi:xanthine dehydrogenase accessory factor
MWYEVIKRLESENRDYVLVTVLGTRGSTPRDCGTKMVVTCNKSYLTIGGGHLEFKAIEQAKQLLSKTQSQQIIENFPLGAKLGQCCGGQATILFESFIKTSIDIMLFGAGHVGKALVSILAGLPCRVHWVDGREHEFPEILHSNTTKIVSDSPSDEVMTMPKNAYYVIMTHNHPLDFAISEAILKRNDAHYIGLIGSKTKWQRFQMRFEHKGFKSERYNRIHCPLGLSDIPGKLPSEVAVAVAGEIISLYHQNQPIQKKKQGVDWRQLKSLIPNNMKLPISENQDL